jgi:hypothetical protein
MVGVSCIFIEHHLGKFEASNAPTLGASSKRSEAFRGADGSTEFSRDEAVQTVSAFAVERAA